MTSKYLPRAAGQALPAATVELLPRAAGRFAPRAAGRVVPRAAGIALCAALLATTALSQTVEIVLPRNVEEDLRATLENASLALSLTVLEDGREQPSATDFIAAARADYRRILTGLYAEGRYGGTISITADGREVSGIAPLDAPDVLGGIVITVTPGPEFVFGQAEVVPLAGQTVLPGGFAPGEVARAEAIRAAVSAATAQWRAEGYPRVAPGAQQITANHPGSTLDARVEIVTGPQLRFGPLAVTGNEAVRTQRIVEIAGLPEGEIYSPRELDRAQTRLRRAGAFSAVALIERETDGPDGTLPITAQITEAAPRRIGFGAEYSTLDGVTLSAFWLHRNLLGGAERFRIDGEVSGIETGNIERAADGEDGVDYRIALAFSRPATFRPDIDLTLNFEIGVEDEPRYYLEQISASGGLLQYSTDTLTLEAGLGVLIAREETPTRDRDYTLITAPLSGTLDRRDKALDPTSGYYLDLDVTPFVGVSGDAGSGARLLADARAYYSFGADARFTLAARGQIGSVVGADVTEAPADYLFYSGGGGTVRGLPYQSLGLTYLANFGDGVVVAETGGASFVGAQFEARVGVTDAISLVGFYDFGMVGPDAVPRTGDDYHAGAGFGLRYDTGIGPIRLDVATPVTGDDAYENVEFYIGIGQAF